MKWRFRAWCQESHRPVSNLALPLTTCVTSGKFSTHCEPLFSHRQMGIEMVCLSQDGDVIDGKISTKTLKGGELDLWKKKWKIKDMLHKAEDKAVGDINFSGLQLSLSS